MGAARAGRPRMKRHPLSAVGPSSSVPEAAPHRIRGSTVAEVAGCHVALGAQLGGEGMPMPTCQRPVMRER